MLVLAVVTGVSVTLLYRHFNGSITVVPIPPGLNPGRPPKLDVDGSHEPLNILVMGSDSSGGLERRVLARRTGVHRAAARAPVRVDERSRSTISFLDIHTVFRYAGTAMATTRRPGLAGPGAAAGAGTVGARRHRGSGPGGLAREVAHRPAGLLVIAEVARRLAAVVRTGQDSDPFTAATSRALASIGKLIVVAGLGAWVVRQVARAVLAGTMLDSADHIRPHQLPLGWLVVGAILTGFALILDRGVEMRAELDSVI
jgi:hypothetical protein